MTDVAQQAGWAEVQSPPRQSSADPSRPLELVDDTVTLRLADLKTGICPRRGGLQFDHIKTLAELGGCWPPILVSRRDNQVIDGLHRLEAARLLGHPTIVAKLFDGSEDEAYVAAIKCNVEHGLPLTLAERKDGANHILRVHPSWSDRRIASICGLSPATLGTLRARIRTDSGLNPQDTAGERRIGRDGRSRPVDTAASRRRVAEAIADTPDLSLRKIGAHVGSSPETVRSVRVELEDQAREVALRQWWRYDAALSSTSGGKQLLGWLGRANIDRAMWRRYIDAIPVSRVYDLAAEARRRASAWSDFAEELEAKVRGSKP
jgi:ParB-like chromosome segregation protein Spo0J